LQNVVRSHVVSGHVVNSHVVCPRLRRLTSFRLNVEILSLKEFAEERRCFIRDAANLVRCLTIEFKIELGLGSTVVPLGKKFELASPQAPLRQRGGSDSNAHAGRLPGDPAFLWDRFGRGDDAARDETWPAFVLAREDEDRIAFGDMLATIHCLLRAERERLCLWIANLGFDRERHTPLPSRSLARMMLTSHY
jgi:hypothetical protein